MLWQLIIGGGSAAVRRATRWGNGWPPGGAHAVRAAQRRQFSGHVRRYLGIGRRNRRPHARYAADTRADIRPLCSSAVAIRLPPANAARKKKKKNAAPFCHVARCFHSRFFSRALSAAISQRRFTRVFVAQQRFVCKCLLQKQTLP